MLKHISKKVKDKYEILGVIGEGAYGIVLKARERTSDHVVAIKHFKQAPGYNSDLDVIERELRILQSLSFENVVRLIEWFRDKKRCFLIFEYVDSNMLQVLQEHPRGLPLDDVRKLSYQLFSAIHWCHTHDIIHRDIKPENLLISKAFVLKLCDFGFARFCNTQASSDYYTNYVATRWYRAPELLSGSPYGKPADIWACGCIMAELATGRALFAGESDIDQLYRIQQSLGPLPIKYLEEMIRNPKFEGLKFPTIRHLDPLESHFCHVFPPDMLDLFQVESTLKLCAVDRLTGEQCMQHDAFHYLHQKRSPQQSHASEDRVTNHATSHAAISLRNSGDKQHTVHTRHRSPPIRNHESLSRHDDLPFASASFTEGQGERRHDNRLTDRSASFNHHRPRIGRVRAKTYSSSTDEDEPASMLHSRTSMDNIEYNSNLLRKTYFQSYQSTPSVREPPIPAPPAFRYGSNDVLFRQKKPSLINSVQPSSKDTGKRLSLDPRQMASSQTPQQSTGSHVYRSSMIIVPERSANANAIRMSDFLSTSLPLEDTEEEPTKDVHYQRSRNHDNRRDRFRSKSVHFHPSSDTAADAADNDSGNSMSTTYLRNSGDRRHVFGSDSVLTKPSDYNLSFERPTIRNNKTANVPQHDASAPTKIAPKSILAVQPKTSNDGNRATREKQSSSTGIFGVYPFARNAVKHVAHALMPSGQARRTAHSTTDSKAPRHDS